jgi:small subunit ribosomal protein S9
VSDLAKGRGTGRRKSAVARVRLTEGSGRIFINGKELPEYFPEMAQVHSIVAPLHATETANRFDVQATVNGGGINGQAGAVVLGIGRALKSIDHSWDKILRDMGCLTRDSRMKERKKYGQKGARKRFQFSKR